jgi:hypothetical protein
VSGGTTDVETTATIFKFALYAIAYRMHDKDSIKRGRRESEEC